MAKFKAPQTLRGVKDILPIDQPYWMHVEDTFRQMAFLGGFEKITLPTLEAAELFTRSVGEETDIVSKEMYIFKDRSDNQIALRPEGTAGIVRAYIENGMKSWPKPVKLWYWGSMFRYDRPQAGRYREFYQGGLEVLGEADASADAQLIALAYKFLTNLGLKDLTVQINSLGSLKVRPKIIKQIVKFLDSKKDKLCDDCRERLKKNPMRVLDCKNASCQAQFVGLDEVILNNIDPEDRKHFMKVLEYIGELGIPYELNSRLVRGLDYYTRTVFEITQKGSDQSIAAGGRYDNLVEDMGGDITPAIGFATGVDRIVELLKSQNIALPQTSGLDAYIVQLGDKAKLKAIKVLGELEEAGYKVTSGLGKDSIKTQLKIADRMGASFAIIIGEQEVHSDGVLIRDMFDGVQETVADKQILKRFEKKLEEKKALTKN
jgi:histidyl-tRNA synthetase